MSAERGWPLMPSLVTANCFDWNARSLHARAKGQELTHELKLYRLDILGLAEVRVFGETTTDAGHKIWYYGEDPEHSMGLHSSYGKKL